MTNLIYIYVQSFWHDLFYQFDTLPFYFSVTLCNIADIPCVQNSDTVLYQLNLRGNISTLTLNELYPATGVPEGTNVTFQCSSGFSLLQGPAFSTCTLSGTWTSLESREKFCLKQNVTDLLHNCTFAETYFNSGFPHCSVDIDTIALLCNTTSELYISH